MQRLLDSSICTAGAARGVRGASLNMALMLRTRPKTVEREAAGLEASQLSQFSDNSSFSANGFVAGASM